MASIIDQINSIAATNAATIAPPTPTPAPTPVLIPNSPSLTNPVLMAAAKKDADAKQADYLARLAAAGQPPPAPDHNWFTGFFSGIGDAISGGTLPYVGHVTPRLPTVDDVTNTIDAANNTVSDAFSAWIQSTGGLGVGPLAVLAVTGHLDKVNPLYKDGIQWSDIQQIAQMASVISPGQATVGTALNLGSEFTGGQGVDFYDPKVQAEFKQNNFYNIGTGLVDGADQAAIAYAEGGVFKGATTAMGLKTGLEGAPAIAEMRQQVAQQVAYNKQVESGLAVTIKPTPWGQTIENAAKMSYPRLLNDDLFKNASNTGTAASLFQQAPDFYTKSLVVLANKGDTLAQAELLNKMPHAIFEMSGIGEHLTALKLATGDNGLLPGDYNLLESMFKSKAESNAWHKQALQEFFATAPAGESESGLYTAGRVNDRTMPRGVSGFQPAAKATGKLVSRLADTKTAAQLGEGGFFRERVLGKVGLGEPVNVLVRWVGGKQDLNMIAHSGVRADEAATELTARVRHLGTGDITITRDGAPVTLSSSDYLTGILGDLGKTQIGSKARIDLLERVDQETASAVFHEFGVDPESAQAAIDAIRTPAAKMHSDIAQNQFWLDPTNQSTMARVEPELATQLAQSTTMIDLKALRRQVKIQAGGAKKASALFANNADAAAAWGDNAFRLATLYKLGYPLKNSIGEPILSGFLAGGMYVSPDGLAQAIGRTASGFARGGVARTIALADRMHLTGYARNSAESKVLTDKLQELKNMHGLSTQAEYDLEARTAEMKQLKYKSPQFQQDYGSAIKDDYDKARATARDISSRLQAEDPMWDDVPRMPMLPEMRSDLAGFRRDLTGPNAADRIEEQALKDEARAAKLPDGNPIKARLVDKVTAQRQRASALRNPALDRAGMLGDIDTANAHLDTLQDKIDRGFADTAASRMAAADIRDTVVDRLQELSTKIGKSRDMRERLRIKTRIGSKDFDISSGTTKIPIPGLFSDAPGAYGDAMKAEVSAERTTRLSVDPTAHVQSSAARLQRTGASRVVNPNETGYFKEYAYILNDLVQQDELGSWILKDPNLTTADVWKWMQTPGGKAYGEKMGWADSDLLTHTVGSKPVSPLPTVGAVKPWDEVTTAGRAPEIPIQVEGHIDRAIRLINQYLPNDDVRTALAKGRITSGKLEQLVPIADRVPVAAQALESVDGRVRSVMNTLWRGIATTPENAVGRFPFAAKRYQQILQRDVDAMNAQVPDGVRKLGVGEINAMRYEAKKQALTDVHETFYNLERYSNAVYGARWFMAFPGAFFNAIYRFGKLAVKNPGRALMANQAWHAMIQSSGVDANGQKTNDPTKAQGIVMDGLPEIIAKAIGADPTIGLSLNALNPVGGNPSPGWMASVAYSSLARAHPEFDTAFKQLIGDTAYNQIFSYGQSDSQYHIGPVALDVLVPSELKAVIQAISPDDPRHLTTVNQIFAANVAAWKRDHDNGVPTDIEMKDLLSEAQSQASKFLGLTALIKFTLPGGANLSTEGQTFRDEYQRLLAVNGGGDHISAADILTDKVANYSQANNGAAPTGQDLQGLKDEAAAESGSFLNRAQVQMIDQHGEWILPLLKSTSDYTFYAPPTQNSYNRIMETQPLLKSILSENRDDPKVASVLFYDIPNGFDQVYYNWLGNNNVGGTAQDTRGKLTPDEMKQELQADDSWNTYDKAKAKTDAALAERGLASLTSSGAEQINSIWQTWLAGFDADPANARQVEERTGAANRAPAVVSILRQAIADPGLMKAAGATPYWDTAKTYLKYYDDAHLRYKTAVGNDAKKAIKAAWQNWISTTLLPQSSQFGAMYDRFLNDKDL